MPFFIRNKSNSSKSKKRVNSNNSKNVNKSKSLARKSSKNLDEEILSDEFEDDDEDINSDSVDVAIEDGHQRANNNKRKNNEQQPLDSEDENETAQEKKIRLAKKYLSQLEQTELFSRNNIGEDDDDAIDDRSNSISTHLKESVLEKLGKLHKNVADRYHGVDEPNLLVMKNGHRKAITAIALSHNGQYVFSGGKDCSIVKWNVENGKRLHTIKGDHRANPETFNQGHTASVQALALSTDFKFLASGCKNKVIHIWNPDQMIHLKTFRGHRGPITGLSFRRSFHQLFSCSEDRMVKVWNLDEMGYVESLLGHHDSITSIDSFVRERCITSGGRDGTIRLWKIPEESNLIFLTGCTATIDCVRFIDESHFLSAADDGSISLWSTFKKKPIHTVMNAHQPDHWIISLASLKNTDLFASGSHDGSIIIWKIKSEFKGIERLFAYKVDGFINALEFTIDGQYLIAAIAQEHRTGRWFERMKNVRNVLQRIPFTMKAI